MSSSSSSSSSSKLSRESISFIVKETVELVLSKQKFENRKAIHEKCLKSEMLADRTESKALARVMRDAEMEFEANERRKKMRKLGKKVGVDQKQEKNKVELMLIEKRKKEDRLEKIRNRFPTSELNNPSSSVVCCLEESSSDSDDDSFPKEPLRPRASTKWDVLNSYPGSVPIARNHRRMISDIPTDISKDRKSDMQQKVERDQEKALMKNRENYYLTVLKTTREKIPSMESEIEEFNNELLGKWKKQLDAYKKQIEELPHEKKEELEQKKQRKLARVEKRRQKEESKRKEKQINVE